MRSLVAVSCVLALGACQPAPEVFTYACADGKTFGVTYDEGFTLATVTSAGKTYKLPAAMSASGARYSDGRVEFWEHQGEAMLNGAEGGDTGSCPPKKAG